MKLLVYSLALFGCYYTHAALPTAVEVSNQEAPDRAFANKDIDPREDPCLTDEEKEIVTDVMVARGNTLEAAQAAIEEFGRLCQPRK